MNTITELTMLEIDLGHLNPPESVANYLTALLNAAEEFLAGKGIAVDHDSDADRYLLVSYAAWLYRKRDNGAGMPRPLEYALRNRIVQAAAEDAP